MTRRSSLRAQAQEFYREMGEGDGRRASLTKELPTLTLPLSGGGKESVAGGGEESAQGGGEITSLTARVRALYEGSAVPVREIARLAGVSERTLYKYVAKHGWQKRYARVPRGGAAAEANRGRGFKPAPGFAPAKGAGGRFIRRDDIGKPFATGLKALDAAGEARGVQACAAAGRRAARAEAEALEQRWHQETIRAIQAVTAARDELAAHDAACKSQRGWSRQTELRKRALIMSLKVALDWMEIAIKAWERAALSSLEGEGEKPGA